MAKLQQTIDLLVAPKLSKNDEERVRQNLIGLAQEVEKIRVNPDPGGLSITDLKDDLKELTEMANNVFAHAEMPQIDVKKLFNQNSVVRMWQDFFGVMQAQFMDAWTKSITMAANAAPSIGGGIVDPKAVKSMLKTKADIDKALNDSNKKLLNKKGGINKKNKTVTSINDALGFEYSTTSTGVARQMNTALQEYNDALALGTDNWEAQYAALLKYVEGYKKLKELGAKEGTLKEYGSKIEGFNLAEMIDTDLHRISAEIRASLQSIFSVAEGNGVVEVNIQPNVPDPITPSDITGNKDGKIKVSVELTLEEQDKKEFKKRIKALAEEPDSKDKKNALHVGFHGSLKRAVFNMSGMRQYTDEESGQKKLLQRMMALKHLDRVIYEGAEFQPTKDNLNELLNVYYESQTNEKWAKDKTQITDAILGIFDDTEKYDEELIGQAHKAFIMNIKNLSDGDVRKEAKNKAIELILSAVKSVDSMPIGATTEAPHTESQPVSGEETDKTDSTKPSSSVIDAHRKENAELDEKTKKYNELVAKAAQYSDFKAFEKYNLHDMIDIGVSSHEESKEIWKAGRYASFKPTEMNLEDAVDIIRNKVPENILDGWFRNADSGYKDKLEELALSDEEIRNAALNIMFSNYKGATGSNISFDEFIKSEIPVYRGKNSEKYVKGDEILSFSFDEKMAEKFGKHILQTVMKPIDTIGSYQTTAESEVFLRRNQLEAKPEYQDWHNRMAGIVNSVNNTVEVLNTLPSPEDIKNGNASWRGMPIKYNPNQQNEGSNHGTYMSLGPKYFELDDGAKLDTLNHEVAHTLADRILATATENWNDVMSIFLKKVVNSDGKEYFEGLYGDLGATAGSETITRAVNEYFNDPTSLQSRSADAYNYIDQYVINTGENLDNIAQLEQQKQAQENLNNEVRDGQKAIEGLNSEQAENNKLRQESEQIGGGQIQSGDADSAAMAAEIDKLKYDNSEKDSTISGLQAQLDYTEEENKKLRNYNSELESEVESWKSDFRCAEENAAEYRADLQQIEQLRNQLSEAQKDAESWKSDFMLERDDSDKYRGLLELEQEKHERTRDTLISAYEEIDSLKSELTSGRRSEPTDDSTSKPSGINKSDIDLNNLKTTLQSIIFKTTHVSAAQANEMQTKDALRNAIVQASKYANEMNAENQETQSLLERAITVFSDGTVAVGNGVDGHVSQSVGIASRLQNLDKTPILSAHTHPLHTRKDGLIAGATDFSHGDFISASQGSAKGLNSAYAMFVGNLVRIIDTTEVTDEQFKVFNSALEQERTKLETLHPQLFTYNKQTGKHKSNPNANSERIAELLNTAIKAAAETAGITSPNFNKQYNLTNPQDLNELVNVLYKVSEASNQCVSTFDRLSDLLKILGVDTGNSTVQQILHGYKVGAYSVEDVFGQLSKNGIKGNTLLPQVVGALDQIKLLDGYEPSKQFDIPESMSDVVDANVISAIKEVVKSTQQNDNRTTGLSREEIESIVGPIVSGIKSSDVDGKWALDSTARDIRDAIKANNTPQSDVATEGTLGKIRDAVNAISGKIQGTAPVQPRPINNNGNPSSNGSNSLYQDEINKLDAQLELYRVKLEHAGKLSQANNDEINRLSGLLHQSTNQGNLMHYKNEFGTFKAFVGIDDSFENKERKDSLFDAKVETQYSSLSLLYAQLESSGKLTDEVKTKWAMLWDTLGQVDDVNSLQLWQQSLTQIKNEINEIALANKGAIADSKSSFDQLVAVSKLYNQMSVGAERANGDELKAFYTEEANKALVEQKNLLNSIKLTKEQQAHLDKLEEERQRKIAEVQAKKADNANKLKLQKQEQENLQELLSLHEKIGEWDAISQYTNDEETKKAAQEHVDILKEQIKKQRELMKLSEDDHRFDDKSIDAYSKGRKRIAKPYEDAEEKKHNEAIRKAKQLAEELGKQKAIQAAGDNSDGMKSLIADTEKLLQQKREELGLDQAELDLLVAQAKVEKERAIKGGDERKELRQQLQERRRDARLSRTNSAINAADDAIISVGLMDDNIIDPTTIQQVRELQRQLEVLKATRKNFEVNPDSVDVGAMKNQTAEVVKQTAALKELIRNYEYFSDENSVDLKAQLDPSGNIQAQLENAAKSYHGLQIKVEGYDAATKTLTYTVKSGANEFTTYTAGVRDVDGALRAVQGTTKKTEGFFDGIGRKMKEVFQYFSGSSIIYEAANQVRQGIQYVRDIDLAMTELKKVTDETEESYDRFLQTASKTDAKIGSTISDFTQATATFAKLGYNMNLASEMAEAAIVYQNVGDDVASADDAANSIISTMKGFGLEASESMAIVDRFNEVGNRFAITSTEIGDALQRSASALSMSGNTIDESIGLITSAQTVIQDAEKVGTALKTLSLRLRSTKGELEEAGEDTDGMAESVTKLQQQLLRLTHGKVNIMIDANNFKNTTQIIREMAQAWDSMTDVERAEALELMGGKQQANVLSALIQNFDIAENAIKASATSSGSALAENEKILDSIEGKITQFNNAVQAMWSDTLDSDLIKGFVELGTILVKIIDQLGMIPSLLVAIGAFKGAKTLFQGFNPTSLLNDIKDLTMGTKVFDATTRKTTLSLLAQQMQFNLASSSLVQYAIKMGLATSADVAKMTTTQLLGLSFKALGTAIVGATKAIIAFLFTNPIGWVILLTGAIAGGIAIFNKLHKTTEELRNELSQLKSDLSDIETKLKSLNGELTTTQSRMAELLAMDTLSFTEQEELDNLRKQNDELQREIDLLELSQKQKQKETAKKFIQTMTSDSDEYYADGSKANWFSDMGLRSSGLDASHISEAEAIDVKIRKYQDYVDELAKIEQQIINAGGEDTKNGSRLSKQKDNIEKEISEIETFIQDKVTQWNQDSTGLEYFTGDNLEDWQKETNEWLDYIDNVEDKWAIALGESSAKTNAINRIFNKAEYDEASKAIDALVEQLKQNPGDATLINQIRQQCLLASEDLHNVGLSIDDAVASFTQFASSSSFDTLEGKIAELSEASKTLEDLLHIRSFKLDGLTLGLVDLFDKEGKVSQDKLSQIFNNTSKQTRADITSILENSYDDIKNGTENIETLLTQFSFRAGQQILNIQKTMLASANKELFPNLKDEISGIIDTFDELASAVGSVVDAMDLLDKARAEEAYSGSISLETLLNLMQYTEDYAKIVSIDETGAIHLAKDAQSILIQEKLNAIKANAQLAYEEANKAYQEALAAETSVTAAGAIKNAMLPVIDQVSGGLAFLGSLWDSVSLAWSDGFGGNTFNLGSAISQAQSAYNSTISDRQNGRQQEYATNLEAAERALQEAEDRLEFANSLTADNVKTKYSSEDASGGTKNKDEADGKKAQDAFDALRKKYENKIKLLEAQQQYLENEISIAEANDEQVGRAVYDEQIRLEEEKIKLYADELAALKAHMQTLGKGTDEWYECADAVWEVEHSIQESTLAVAEFKQEIANLYIEVFEKIQEAFGKQQELYQKQGEYIRNEIEYAEATDQPVNRDYYIGLRETKQNEYNSAIKEGEALANALKLGVNAEGEPLSDEEIADMTLQLMDSQLKAQGLRNEIANINNELEDLYITALEKVDEAFAAISDLYSDRRSYVTNQIDIKRAQDENYMPVKADYQYLIDQNKAERESLMQEIADYQKMLDDGIAVGDITEGDETWVKYHEHIRDTVLEVQDLDKETAEYINNMKDLWVEAFNKIQSGYDKLGTVRSNRQSYIEKYMELMEVTDQPITTSYYELILDEQQNQYREAVHEIEDLRREQQEALESGDIEVGTERWWEMESAIQAAEAKVMDFQVQIAQTGEELKNLYYDAFNKVADAFGDEHGVYDDQQAFIDSYIDYLNTMEVGVPAELYEKKIEIERQSLERNMENLNGLYAKRDRMLAQGFTYKDEELVEANSKINEIEKSVWESKAAIEEWNKAIRELDISKFEEIQKRISDIFDELENVYGLVSDEDMATEDGVWTDEGITSLGLMIQKMEMAKAQIQEYQNEIDKLTEEYESGAMSEQEYNDRLVELKNSQWDTVNAYESAKDAIIDIHEARVDMIEEGIESEISAYEELIRLKQEELDAEKD